MPCGTTGEVATLSRDEHREVIAHAVRVANGRVPVIAGCGSYSTAASLEMIRAAADVGADAALVVVPYYNKPSQAGLAAHFEYLADHSPVPIVVYNVPSRTVADISVETLARVAKNPKIVGIKDATAISPAFQPSGSRAGRISASCRAMTTWRSASTPWAAWAASRSPPMSRRGSAPISRMPCFQGIGRGSDTPGQALSAPRGAVLRRFAGPDQICAEPRPPRFPDRTSACR